MNNRGAIWIDLDNTPHVPFFQPIARELEAKGCLVSVSAREAFQVGDLAEMLGLHCVRIGRHYGKNPFMKVTGLVFRSLQLLPFVLMHRPVIALSHGSRSQILLCNVLRIPTVMIMDYEHAQTPFLLRPRWEIVPAALVNERLQCRHKERVLTYEGIKEDVYVPEFQADDEFPKKLGLDNSRIVVTVRPPASEAHYHNPESDTLFVAFMEVAQSQDNVQVILLPRNKKQENDFRKTWPKWFEGAFVIVPKLALDGLNLLWHSDLVVSGGGTMNREAAALGIPVYSIFRGPTGAIDRKLSQEGRLVVIESVEQIRERIVFEKRKNQVPRDKKDIGRPALNTILNHVERIIAVEKVQCAMPCKSRGS